jgi:hypothetical protein
MKSDDMKNEQKTKKGFFGILRESFSKTSGCCCGPGESCDGPSEESDQPRSKETPKSKAASKAAQKQR